MKTEQVEDLAHVAKKFLSFSDECFNNNIIDEETYISITHGKIKFLEEVKIEQG